MLTVMKDLPEGVVGFSAEGNVTDEDYKTVLIPAVEAAIEKHKSVHLLYYLGPDFKHFGTAAMWDDAMFGMRHFFDFGRIAVVTDHEALAMMVRSFGLMMPAAVRVFPTDKLEAAKAWLGD
jgi:hypothetical protein